MSELKRRPGRPRTKIVNDKGATIGLRAPKKLKDRLQKAADSARRSLSTEAQFRLEQSFDRPEDAFTSEQRVEAILMMDADRRGGPVALLRHLLRRLDQLGEADRRQTWQAMLGSLADFERDHPEVKGSK